MKKVGAENGNFLNEFVSSNLLSRRFVCCFFAPSAAAIFLLEQNQGGSPDQIGTTEEFRQSREAFWEQEIVAARSEAVITDPVIIEKLNLAYEDLTAIYDLRSHVSISL